MSSADLDALEALGVETKAESDSENTIEVKKKPRTAKQIEAFKLVLAKRDANRKTRTEETQRLKAEEKAQLEAKVVKKAVSIKKKQIKKQIVLDEISDDDEPIESIKKKITASKPRVRVAEVPISAPPPVVPKFTFV